MSTAALDAIKQAAGLLSAEERAEVLGALLAPLAPAPGAAQPTLTPGEAATLNGCAEVYVPLVQWYGADLTPRGVWLRAPTYRICMAAERAATTRHRDGGVTVDEWRQMAEQVAACIVRPRVTVDTLLDWNVQVVYALHRRAWAIADLPAELVAAELARLAGRPAPAPAEPTAGAPWGSAPASAPVPQPEPRGDGAGGDAGPPAGPAAEQPGRPEPGDGGA